MGNSFPRHPPFPGTRPGVPPLIFRPYCMSTSTPATAIAEGDDTGGKGALTQGIH